MKILYLLRHADAQRTTSGNDSKRFVSTKGIQELERLTSFLLSSGLKLDAVFCSSALRTKQSWEFLKNSLGLETKFQLIEELYNPLPDEIIKFINNVDNSYNSILIISHNPVISQTANDLLVTHIDNFSTCNMACIGFDLDTWCEITNNLGTLIWFHT